MIRYFLNKLLLDMQDRYDYDVRYMQDILQTDIGAYFKFMAFQTLSAHAGNLPAEPLFAARLRAIIWDDCGPCTQLITNMALEAGVSPETVRAIVNHDLSELSERTSLVVRFTDLVLAHNPEADDLRKEILAYWGNEGLITIGFAISSCRVYPALKYTLGYGAACHRVMVNNHALVPNQEQAKSGEAAHAE